ncbi:MAG: acetyltransferase [Candidatus Omnitrophica bacterium]|nr:acetyltransferase [Candidatus Omnitrophota bacterium]
MKKPAAVLGAGGHARVVASILEARRMPVLGFFDDSFDPKAGEKILGRPVLGRFRDILKFKGKIGGVYLAVGDNASRKKFFNFFRERGFSLPSITHPSAFVEKNARIGEGSVVCLGAIVGAGATVGKGCIVNSGASLDHESRLGDFSHLAPKSVVAGRTSIGESSFVGMNAAVADCLAIGAGVTIGAGSVVLRNVPDHKKVLGVWH